MPRLQDVDDRRAHPRTEIGLKRTMEVVQHPNKVPIIDISKGGVKFLSEQPFEVGSIIKVGTSLLIMEVKVLECSLVEVDQGLMEFRYQVRCEYDPDESLTGEDFFEMVVQQ